MHQVVTKLDSKLISKDIVYYYFIHFIGIYRVSAGFPAICMEKDCKNKKETLDSPKEKIVCFVGKPCSIYRLWGETLW